MILARILSVLLALYALAPRAALGGPVFHGQVVDAGTGEPLDGSIVVVVWRKTAWYNMEGGGAVLQKVVEEVSDAEGRFSIEDSPGWNLNPFTFRDPKPDIGIFHAGYAPFPVAEETMPRVRRPDGRVEAMSWSEQLAAFRGGLTVRLPRLTSREQFARYSIEEYVVGGVPPNMIPRLRKAINEHRVAAGLQPFSR